MPAMSATCEVSHPERSWLKEEASENMYPMLVTPETSHPEMLPLNAWAPSNMPAMSVTCPRSGMSVAR